MKKFLLPLCLLFISVSSCSNTQPEPQSSSITLSENWQFRQVNSPDWYSATIPGTVHTDLFNAGVIENPFYRDLEDSLQWIEDEDWEYSTVLQVDKETMDKDYTELVFEGLDTYADVYLNDSLIIEANNMFRTWTIPVKPLLKEGENQIRIYFHSPVQKAIPMAEASPYRFPSDDHYEKPTRVFTRKAAYHYGWDWGARFTTSGIWRPVKLKSWHKAHIRDVHFTTKVFSNGVAHILATYRVEATEPGRYTIAAKLADGSLDTKQSTYLESGGSALLTLALEIEDAKKWWPNGLGKANLYEVISSIYPEGEERSTILDKRSDKIGIRTVELITEPDDVGESFYFKVNGHPVYMKGANYIPSDHFTPRVSEEKYRDLFQSMVDANMNMIRLWGGAIYETDLFYDLADEYGILIWQDFMFANGLFPGDQDFLDNVKQEAVQQVKRLRNHPSIALWCGNNEINEGWNNWGWQKQYGYSKNDSIAVWNTYEKIFHEILPEAVKSYDERPYWPSSPSIGWGHKESLTQGDSHYWGVWWGAEPFEVYEQKVPRFASEFGFQGYPSLETVETYTLPEDREIDSRVMGVHQKHPRGLELVTEYMKRDYRDPKDFESFLYVSQVLQAKGMKMAFEAQRRAKPVSMGTLYWQLNDTWPVASWSGIDYYGRWKALHYTAKHSFDEILVSPFIEDDKVNVYINTDRLEDTQAKLQLRLISFEGEELFADQSVVGLPGNSSNIYYSIDVDRLLEKANSRTSVLYVEVTSADNTVLADNTFYFERPKDLDLPSPNIQASINKLQGNTYEIELSTDRLAKNVYLKFGGSDGRFADNYFDLIPGITKRVTVNVESKKGDLHGQLKIQSLVDSYK